MTGDRGILHSGSQPALIDAATGAVLSRDELQVAVNSRVEEFCADPAGLTFLAAETSTETIIDLVALLQCGQPVALVDPQTDKTQASRLLAAYQPDRVIDRGGAWPTGAMSSREASHPDLALLLTTSGSTGSPKFVRLSWTNLSSNLRAVGLSQSLSPSDVAITVLPLHYSYGMSVVLSHLAAGSTVVVSTASVMEPLFWEAFERYGATILNTVPYLFHILRRTGFFERDLPTLRAVTQAGGRLDPKMMRMAVDKLTPQGVGLYVMYGQTEAAPRIACLPPDRLEERFGSVGLPLEGGTITIEDEPAADEGSGQVVYSGPNVMLGYAETRADLALGDVTGGRLSTGDLGYLDDEGFLFLTGRSKRIGKVFGVRISLDEVEQELRDLGAVAAVAGTDRVVVFVETSDTAMLASQRPVAAGRLRIPAAGLELRAVEAIPLLPNGKVDYRSMEKEAGS